MSVSINRSNIQQRSISYVSKHVNCNSCKQYNVHFKTRGIRFLLKAGLAMINRELNQNYMYDI